jgi:hypothetical protein
MNPRQPSRPPVADRLPGEEELSHLYQQTPEDQPPTVLDATVLAAAHQTTQSRPRQPKVRFFGQVARRWAVPLSLAATLLASIGVITNVREKIAEPVQQLSPPASRPTLAAPPATEDMVQSKEEGEAAFVASQPPVPAPLAGSPPESSSIPAARETVPSTAAARPRMKDREALELRGLMGEQKQAKDLAPEAWLAHISELFRAGKQHEAEANLHAFRQRYPHYTDYPDSLPAEVLKRVRPR